MRKRLRVEHLESRDCPALVVQSVMGHLTIRGIPNGNVTVTETSPNTFTVVDNGKAFAPAPCNGNMSIRLPSRPGFFRVDLNGNSLNGNLLLDLGDGYSGSTAVDYDVSVYDSTATSVLSTSAVRGNVSVLKGNGNELVGVGYLYTVTSTPVNRPLQVLGGLNVAGRMSVTFGESFQLGEGSKVAGAASVSYYDDVTFGQQDVTAATLTQVQGNVTVTTGGAGGGLRANFFGRFEKNLTVNAAATTTGFNTFTITSPDPNVDAYVGGNLNVVMGQSGLYNSMQVLQDTGGTGVTQVVGQTTLVSRNSIGTTNDFVSLDGQFDSSVLVQTGNQGLDFDFPLESKINGMLTIIAGSGTNNIGTGGTNTFAGTLQGHYKLYLGSGTNNVDLQTSIGGVLLFRAGDGVNNVNLTPADPSSLYRVNMLFGPGTNTLTLNANVIIRGIVKGSDGTNTFNQNNATIISRLFSNFP